MKPPLFVICSLILVCVFADCSNKKNGQHENKELSSEVTDSLREDSMTKSWQTLKTLNKFNVEFIGTIGGYRVSAEFYPDTSDSFKSIGKARYHFSSKGKDFFIENGFYWCWWIYLDSGHEGLKHNGNRFCVKIDLKALQGEEKEIEDVECLPFVLKDVDFDGEREILLRTQGYNRYYWNAYKIIGNSKAAFMSGKPYNNLVYGANRTDPAFGVSETRTEFDYKKKTIYCFEEIGYSKTVESKYIKIKMPKNILAPMKELYHKERK